jgi:hypothetical protein
LPLFGLGPLSKGLGSNYLWLLPNRIALLHWTLHPCLKWWPMQCFFGGFAVFTPQNKSLGIALHCTSLNPKP